MEEKNAAPRAGGNQRLEVVDALRGFALAGLFLVHIVESYELYWFNAQPDAVSDTVFLLLMGKSFSLLAMCFGFSFFILMDRAAQRGVDFTARFAWRLAILIGIGTLHSWIYRGDIIQLLALMGFLLIPMHRVKDNRVLIGIAIIGFLGPLLLIQTIAAAAGMDWANRMPFFVDDPAMQAYVGGAFPDYLRANLGVGQAPKWWFMLESGRLLQIFALYLTGMVLGRIGFFARLDEFARARRIALAIAVVAAPVLYFVREPLATALIDASGGEAAGRWLRYLLASWFELAGATIWALLLIALYQSGARGLLRPFIPMGRLTLTLYIAQSVVFVPVFYEFGLGLWNDWDSTTRLGVGLAAVAGQMAFAWAWLRHFQYGPLEWAWRSLTYLSRDVPFQRRPRPAAG